MPEWAEPLCSSPAPTCALPASEVCGQYQAGWDVARGLGNLRHSSRGQSGSGSAGWSRGGDPPVRFVGQPRGAAGALGVSYHAGVGKGALRPRLCACVLSGDPPEGCGFQGPYRGFVGLLCS